MSDRTVHARYVGDFDSTVEVVRYDRAGKWFLESGGTRRPLTLPEAAKVAVSGLGRSGTVFFGLPGGKRFDAKVRGRA